MNFYSLQMRLVETVRGMIHSGTMTERGLARATGISQPHIHNVLKGVRFFSIETSDHILRQLNLSVMDLYSPETGWPVHSVRFIPMLQAEIGPGCPRFPAVGTQLYPLGLELSHPAEEPVAARLSHDPEMSAAFRGGDIVVLDCHRSARMDPGSHSTYVVDSMSGVVLRHVCREGGRLYLVSEAAKGDPSRWEDAHVTGRATLEIFKARVLWVGRHLESQGSNFPDPC